MAETVKEELIRKLMGANAALSESAKAMERYRAETEMLTTRVRDLMKALSALIPELDNMLANNPDWKNIETMLAKELKNET